MRLGICSWRRVGEDGGELEWVSEVEKTTRARERVVRMG